MKNAGEPSQSMQRVRVGLIGLAVVVLLIGLASAVMRSASHEAPVAAVGAPRAEVVANMAGDNQQETGEPLAELGVAPAPANIQGAARSR